ncbi:5-formyltetrahydrofolate cyclo-ligase [Sulfurimonas denitrificans DSM 1251]|uniref:5-formyltetrahydrofolate cyclo-ligase n=1 Tax=Sulfurimonas denitrificans (strain ATCC 33889 / DSM 1251) TaxID=326298 RepID=Q30SA8_SULDN|nr:5-formyltetrahydrofolate cyclo-ligase [Sulfurimonas denitrificans]ABB44123.1 5-formyltetrahydrofolate cyclo-ligase [Sulfurimonas denitrificans DSM 1251]MDD3441868.1 5-formyltetrahydrofolate cyclo-ligase [Sulfurimonas denitrificans]
MALTKVIFRQNCLNKIKNSSKHNCLYKNKKISNQLIKELKKFKNKKILFFISLPFEADTAKIIKQIRKKYKIFVPFMQGESFKMVPFRLPLKKKKFGIYEAGNSLRDIKNIDVAIVPVVGVDGNLQRVGFGKGMYDRFFEKLKKRPYTIFIQSEFCFTKELICDDYDITSDLIITPNIRVQNRNIDKMRK